jgi:hypothetical protein
VVLQRILSVKNTPKNNFLTNEPIFNIPIDSGREAKTHTNFKIFSKFVLGEQSGNFRVMRGHAIECCQHVANSIAQLQ